MLFEKRHSKNLKTFKFRIPEEEEKPPNKIPPRLAIGLLAPFVIVTIFLLVFSQKKVEAPPAHLAQAPAEDLAPPEEANEPAPHAGSEPRERLPELEAVSPVGMPAAAPLAPAGSAKPNQDLTFFMTLKEGEGPALGNKGEPQTKTAPKSGKMGSASLGPSKIEKKAKVPSTAGPAHPAATPPSAVMAPAAGKPTEVAKAVVPPAAKPPVKTPSAAREFAIQVGASQNQEEAERLAFKLKEQGYDAYILAAKIPEKGLWYRVRVGHYKERALAEEAGKKLTETEQLPFFIVSNE